ncbi:MAG TPA: hypothetical protein VIV57_17450, partial [Anaeromyxobacter sp.]
IPSSRAREAVEGHETIGPRTRAMDVKVDCYAGYRGEETPQRFEIDGRRVEVVEVIDRWLGPDHRYFKVRGDDGALYLLRHDEPADRWELKMLERDEP